MTTKRELEQTHAKASDEMRARMAQVEQAAEAMVQTIARDVRSEAARKQHRIGIRIVRRREGVRITITGPDANRYRQPVQKLLEERAPLLKAEIRTMLTRKR
jgi:hypothetical protein